MTKDHPSARHTAAQVLERDGYHRASGSDTEPRDLASIHDFSMPETVTIDQKAHVGREKTTWDTGTSYTSALWNSLLFCHVTKLTYNRGAGHLGAQPLPSLGRKFVGEHIS